MKIILNESQYKLLIEQINLDDFVAQVTEAYPDSIYAMRDITDFIQKSGCQKIEILPFKYFAWGAALYDKVIINSLVFKKDFTFFLYVIFHEIAHQYQYKKYGVDTFYNIYLGNTPIRQGAELIKNIEHTADEFAFRKIRQINKMHGDKIQLNLNGIKKVYENVRVEDIEHMIKEMNKVIRKANVTTKEDITDILYNHLIR